MTSLSASKDRVRAWLMDQALPLWAERGVDAAGGFHEALDFDARPVTGVPRRTRVQARQVYVFCEAATLGWAQGRAVAAAGLTRMIQTCRRDDGLWRLTTDDDGRPLDDTVDLYDQAFVLFALAAAHRTLDDERARPLALETVEAIRTRMTSPHGGWDEAIPTVLPRRQNPHMHLLEAMLAWRETAPDPAWDAVMDECLTLFRARLLNGSHVREYFTQDWRPDPDLGDISEPGHSYEWAWLLEQPGVRMDRRADIVRALYEEADSLGFRSGYVVRELENGRVRDGGRRLWAQTEAIRTALALGDRDGAAVLLDRVFATHLATSTPGLWMDSYDAEGQPCDSRAPASTLYHLMTAFSAVLRGRA